MNIFESEHGILGKFDLTSITQGTRDFIEQARLIRGELGRQSYLLDNYLNDLLTALHQTLIHDSAIAGFDGNSPLRRICTDIIRGKGNTGNHAFYQTAEVYINEHPLPYQEISTLTEFFNAALSDVFLEHIYPLAFEKYADELKNHIDYEELIRNYKECASVVGKEAMEKLNQFLSQRFMLCSAMAAFSQGLTDAFLQSLTHRDKESQKTIIQLWLENEEGRSDHDQ